MNNETRQLWTPTITAGTTVGDLSVTYTQQTGVWAQSGSIVVLGCAVQFTPTYTTATGALVIAGVPFSIIPPEFNVWGIQLVAVSPWAWGGTNTTIGGTLLGSPPGAPSGRIGLNYSQSGGGSTSVRITDITSGTATRISFSMSYVIPGA